MVYKFCCNALMMHIELSIRKITITIVSEFLMVQGSSKNVLVPQGRVGGMTHHLTLQMCLRNSEGWEV